MLKEPYLIRSGQRTEVEHIDLIFEVKMFIYFFRTNNVQAAPHVANPVYELQEDVYALRVAENEDNEYDRHLEIGMLLVFFRSFDYVFV